MFTFYPLNTSSIYVELASVNKISALEDASGEREQKCWFREGGCHELSEMVSGIRRDCC